MSLFLNLYLGHLLGDFMLQPGRLVLAKRDGARGLFVHVLIVAGCSAAVLFGSLREDVAAIAMVAILHAVIERITIVTYLKTPTRGLFTLLLDQAMHVLSIALVVWLARDWRIDTQALTFGVPIGVQALAAGVAVLAVSLFGSILAFETVNAVTGGEGAKGRVLRLDAARVGGFAERGTALAAALVLHPAAMALPFLPRIAYSFTRAPEDRRRLRIEAAAGLALCLIGYGFVALVSYLSANRAALEAVEGVVRVFSRVSGS